MEMLNFKKLIKYPAILTAGICMSTAALAGGPDVMTPQPSFSGLFMGLGLGFKAIDYKRTSTRNGTSASASGYSTITQAAQQIHLGYGYELNNHIYLGLVANASYSEGKNESNTTIFAGSWSNTLKFNWTYGANANIGYALTPRFMPYIIAGWQWQNVDFDSVRTENVFPSEQYNDNGYVNGPDIGLGLRFKVTHSVMVGAEYTASFFNKRYTTDTVDGATYNASIDPQSVMTGLLTMDYLLNM
jgi:opacity protein-like surface antigen